MASTKTVNLVPGSVVSAVFAECFMKAAEFRKGSGWASLREGRVWLERNESGVWFVREIRDFPAGE